MLHEEYKRRATSQAGHKGGERTSQTHGRDFYVKNGQKGGRKGGARVRELIDEGKTSEQ